MLVVYVQQLIPFSHFYWYVIMDKEGMNHAVCPETIIVVICPLQAKVQPPKHCSRYFCVDIFNHKIITY